MSHTMLSSLVPAARDRAGDDPIFQLNAEARRRAASGESILNATIGALMTDEGRLAVLPSVLQTLSECHSERTAGYAPISGLPAFRDAVLATLFAGDPLAERSMAVATPGGTGAIHQAVVNFLAPGQKLLTTSFFWGPYRAIATHAGRGIETFRMFDDDGALDIAALETGLKRQVDQQGRVLLVLNFPCHNPTGYSLSDEEWREVAQCVNRLGARAPLTVLIDAAYMRYGGASELSWMEGARAMLAQATVLVAWTASKAYTQYGARVGALVALHRDAGELAQIENALGYTCRATWSNCNHLGQTAIARMLTEPALRERSGREQDALCDLLQRRVDAFNRHAERAGLPVPRYDSGFFVAVFSPDGAETARVMRGRGVYVVPIEGAVRVALCCTPEADVPRLVEALEAGVAAVR